MYLVLLVLGIRLNTLTLKFLVTSGTAIFAIWIIDIVTTTTAFIYFDTVTKI